MYFDPPTISGYTSETMGSAGDDDVSIILIGVVYTIIFLFFVLKKWKSTVILVVINIGAFLSLFCVGMMAISSVRFTIVAGRNSPLLLIVINQALMLLFAYILYISNPNSIRRLVGKLK